MSLLQLVYWSANVLAGLAIIGALGVMAARIVRGRIEVRRTERRHRLSLEIATSLADPAPAEETLRLMRQDPRLSVDVLQELSELIAGSQRDMMCSLARSAGLDRWLIHDLRSPRAARRRSAAETIRLFDTPEVVEALKAALDDRDLDVRFGAALSLVELGKAPPLLELVKHLEFQDKRHPLILRRLLNRIAPYRLDELKAIADGQQGAPHLRPFAIEAIGASGHLDCAAWLVSIANDKDVTIRASVLRALALLGSLPSRAVLIAGLNDPAWEVRTQAIQAARRLGCDDLGPRIAELLQDEAWWVRFRAREFLEEMGGAGVEALRGVVNAATEVDTPEGRAAAGPARGAA